MILIPIKNLGKAKQRLAAVLDQSSRTELAQAMLMDVLETVNSLPDRPYVCLVTNDLFAVEAARRYGYDAIADHDNLSETDAIESATQVCAQRGATFTLVLPGDIPLVTAAELDQILKAAPPEGSVLVPSADRRGTNAVLRRPSGFFPLRFGDDSFPGHVVAAKASGKPCVVLSLPGVGLDIDTPADLAQLRAAPGETRSQQLARRWDCTSMALAADLSR